MQTLFCNRGIGDGNIPPIDLWWGKSRALRGKIAIHRSENSLLARGADRLVFLPGATVN
jgi:hypothetical protein